MTPPPSLKPQPSAFRPARFLGAGDAQTMWPHFFRRVPSVHGTREVWAVPPRGAAPAPRDPPASPASPAARPVEHDDVDLEGLDGLDVLVLPTRPGQPGVVVLHGLEARAESTYMRGLLAAIQAAGWNGVAVSFPSCGPSAERQRGLYHAGKTDDLAAILDRARSHWHTDVLGAIGVSLGGNVLLKYLGETGQAARLAAGVTISVPYDLAVCAARLDAPGALRWLYRERFLRSLRRKARRVAARPASPLGGLTHGDIARIRTFADFDERVTAPLFGFADARAYWRQCSSLAFLPDIARPTLLVSARDDPFVDPDCLPMAAVAANPALQLWLSEQGGHVGFVSGSVLRPEFVAERLAIQFLAAHLGGAGGAGPAHPGGQVRTRPAST
jgi:predicted alpha/beta-fold hydrolase